MFKIGRRPKVESAKLEQEVMKMITGVLDAYSKYLQ
jgi:hypothetical protein